ncbi:MAG: septum formation initiator family protein [Candidatus Aminicenantes bacterium]|nr:septum formation initiator family protein [Candidatus Aminicenantes bacterium]MDH5714830.1 septum formation initiator family protein [Candidatus Aminicenantes bacterium]
MDRKYYRRTKNTLSFTQKTAWVLFIIIIISVIIISLAGDNGVLELYRRKLIYQHLEDEISKLMQENERLQKQIRLLKEDSFTIEKIAREELGLVKQGEIVYLFPRKDR